MSLALRSDRARPRGAEMTVTSEAGSGPSRRAFIAQLGAAVMAAGSSSFMLAAARAKPAGAAIHEDTIKALIAFVVPGSDPYSIAQGESSPNPGGVDAGITDALIETLDASGPAPPPFPTASIAVAAILDHVAQLVNPNATGFGDLHVRREGVRVPGVGE